MPHRLNTGRYGIAVLLSLAMIAGLAGARWIGGDRPAQIGGTDKQKLYLAEQVLIQRCMVNLGFRYWIVPFGDLPVITVHTAFAVPSLAAARIHGYHPASAPPPFNQGPANAYYSKLSPKRRAAWTAAITGQRAGARRVPAVQVRLPQGVVLGHSRLGCVASAERQLYGDYPAWFAAMNTVQALRAILARSVPKDTAYVRAARRWSRCMRGRGYPAATPVRARSAFTRRMTVAPTDREIAVATAAARCAESTGLTAVTKVLQRRYWNVLYRHYRKEVDTYTKLTRTALPAAQVILAAWHS